MFSQRISKDAQEILDRISIVLPANTYMAGGTALAIQIDHRDSFDLDLYSPGEFSPDNILVSIKAIYPNYKIYGETAWQTIHGAIDRTEVSLFCYKYPLIASTVTFNNFPLASIEDIACMKLQAIAGRGLKRDFFDLYKIIEIKHWTLIEIMYMHDQKFGHDSYMMPHLFQSLTYFEDAELKPERATIVEAQWLDVKSFFRQAVPEAQKLYFNE